MRNNKISARISIYNKIIKKANYSPYLLEGAKALSNLKSSLQAMSQEEFNDLLIEEGENYRYLPGYLLGNDYQDCRIQFVFSDEAPKDEKFINFQLITSDMEVEEEDIDESDVYQSGAGQTLLQKDYDLELRVICESLTGTESRLGYLTDEDLNDYLITLKQSVINAASTRMNPLFNHEIAHLKRIKKQKPSQFIKQWRPYAGAEQTSDWEDVNVKTDVELFPREVERISIETNLLLQQYADYKKTNPNADWKEFLTSIKSYNDKQDFIKNLIYKIFNALPEDVDNPFIKKVVNKLSKLYDDLIEGKFDHLVN